MTLLLLLPGAGVAGPEMRVTKMGIEILSSGAPGGEMRVTKFGVEILALESVVGDMEPLDLPDIVPEFFISNWVTQVQLESDWLTAIGQSRTLHEERWALTDRPYRRQQIKFSALSQKETQRLQQQLYRMAGSRSLVPLYCDVSRVTDITGAVVTCDTQNRRFFPNQRVLLARLSRGVIVEWELGLTISVTSTTLTLDASPGVSYTRVYPLLDVEVAQTFKTKSLTRDTMEVDAEFFEVEGFSAFPAQLSEAGLTKYFDWFVLDIRPNRESALEETISHPATVTESGRSSLVLPRGEYAAATISWNFTFLNRANFWRLARFFDIHRGRARAFFAPVDRNELTVVSLTSSYMDIQPYGVFEDAEKLIKFVALDYEIVKVESITDNTTSWRVTFAKAAVNTSPKRVCRASKFRFDQSSLTEEWRSPEICSVNLNAVEIRRDEVLDVGNLPG